MFSFRSNSEETIRGRTGRRSWKRRSPAAWSTQTRPGGAAVTVLSGLSAGAGTMTPGGTAHRKCRGGAPRGERPASLGAERLDRCSGARRSVHQGAAVRTGASRRFHLLFSNRTLLARGRRRMRFAAKLCFAGCLIL